MVKAFEEIKQMLDTVENQQPVQTSDCPNCGWSLNKHQETGELHCPFCGWPWQRRGK